MKTLSLALMTLVSFLLPVTVTAQAPGSAPGAMAAKQTWTGTLVDATCRSSDPAGKCEISPTTKSFGLVASDGKYYRLDATGNSQVESALKQAKTSTGAVMATITGSASGDEIMVSNVKIS
jgi:hypothetical protein